MKYVVCITSMGALKGTSHAYKVGVTAPYRLRLNGKTVFYNRLWSDRKLSSSENHYFDTEEARDSFFNQLKLPKP